MRRVLAFVALMLFVCGAAHAQSITTICAPGGTPASGQSCTLIQPQATNSAVESSHTLKTTGPSTLVDFQVSNTSASVVWVMVFDATTPPTGGGAAVTGCTTTSSSRPCVAKWYQVSAASTIAVSWAPGPFPQLQTGVVIGCSSTGPFTLTYSANCVFSGEAQ